jgi:hypothetical protein
LRIAVEAALRIVGAPHIETSIAQSADEREKQIAAAREAHPVQSYAPMKPRLSYVLSGEAPKEKPQAPGGPEIQTVHE